MNTTCMANPEVCTFSPLSTPHSTLSPTRQVTSTPTSPGSPVASPTRRESSCDNLLNVRAIILREAGLAPKSRPRIATIRDPQHRKID